MAIARKYDQLAWLADAPLFIDGPQIEAFYDAVVRPEYEKKSITLSMSETDTVTTAIEGGVEVEMSASKWVRTVFPFLDANVKAGGKASREHGNATHKAETIELQPISNPHRQLVQLALHYAINLRQI